MPSYDTLLEVTLSASLWAHCAQQAQCHPHWQGKGGAAVARHMVQLGVFGFVPPGVHVPIYRETPEGKVLID